MTLTEVLRHLEISESTWQPGGVCQWVDESEPRETPQGVEGPERPVEEVVGGGGTRLGDAQGAGRAKM